VVVRGTLADITDPDGVVATARQGEVHRMRVTPDQVSWGS
jgi:hypothetical protein